jgi:ribonuclease P protein component
LHAAEQKEERNCHTKSHFHVAFTFIMKLIKLKNNYDFRRVYKKGKSYVCPFFVIYINPNRNNNVRLGITVGKKIGNAVNRNRAKRVITAAFRSAYPQIAAGNDFVIVARTRILNVKSTKVEELLLKLLKEHGALNQNTNENTVN